MVSPRPLNPKYKADPVGQPGPGAARKRRPAQTGPDRGQNPDMDAAERDDALEKVRTVLEGTVNQRIRDAQVARQSSGIEEIWDEDEDQYNGIDELIGSQAGIVKTRDQAPKRGKASKRSRVFLNITKPKTDTAVARVQEMLLPHDDKPWDVGPTPMPELDEAENMPETKQVQLGDGSMAPACHVAALLKEKAGLKSEKMALWIEDKFVEGSVYAEMRKILRDAGRLGSGVLKGPICIPKTSKKWNVQGDVATLMVKEGMTYTSRRIRVQDFFPAPDCGDSIHDGSYVVEREYMTARKLHELAEVPDYDVKAIKLALEEGPRRTGQNRNRLRQDTPGDTFMDAELYEVYYYYGDMTPTDLILLGLDSGKEDGTTTLDEDEMLMPVLPAIVTMLNGRAIKTIVNPNECGGFPYDVFPWEPIDGQPWGRGVPRKMAVSQRGLNAGVRSLLENAGLSAGSQVAYTVGAVVPVDGQYEITGRKLWAFTPNDVIDDITKAFAVFNIPSMQKELSAIIQFWLEMADTLTNLPMLMQGQQAAGTSPDTLGGMKMLLNNSTSPLRVIAKQFDDYMVIPHLRRYNEVGMQSEDCPADAKGDHQISAKGASVLAQREEGVEFLAMLFPVKDDPALRIDPQKLVREMARARGYSMASIQYTDDEWKAKQKQMEGQPPPKAPAVEAAQIRMDGARAAEQARAQDNEAERAFKADQAAKDRATAEMVAGVERQIEEMRLAGQQNISLTSVKAMLAGKAMDGRLKTDEMALKLSAANPTHQGI